MAWIVQVLQIYILGKLSILGFFFFLLGVPEPPGMGHFVLHSLLNSMYSFYLKSCVSLNLRCFLLLCLIVFFLTSFFGYFRTSILLDLLFLSRFFFSDFLHKCLFIEFTHVSSIVSGTVSPAHFSKALESLTASCPMDTLPWTLLD